MTEKDSFPQRVFQLIQESINAKMRLLGSAETIATIAHVREVLIEGSGGKLKDAADHCVCTPSNETPRIQKCHILIGHVISELVKQTIFHQQGGISGS